MTRLIARLTAFFSAICCVVFTCGCVLLGSPAFAGDDSNDVTISIDSATPLLSADTSTYSITLTIDNATDSTLSTGTITVNTNPNVIFTDGTTMQQWADGSLDIWHEGAIGTADVPEVAAHSSQSVTIEQSTKEYPFTLFTGFGARPVCAMYSTSSLSHGVQTRTFVTYSGADASDAGDSGNATSSAAASNASDDASDSGATDSAHTVKLAIVASTAAQSWMTNNDALQKVMLATDDATLDGVIAPTYSAASDDLTKVFATYPSLFSLVSDPCSAGNSTATITQPAGIDLSKIAHVTSAQWSEAGITDDTISAEAARSLATSSGILSQPSTGSDSSAASTTQGSISGATASSANDGSTNAANATNAADPASNSPVTDNAGSAQTSDDTGTDDSSDLPTIAWQGNSNWTPVSLNYAIGLGYTTAMQLSGSTDNETDSYNPITSYTASSGSIRIINTEETLSNLANGKSTSSTASGEMTPAGRVNRLMAQMSLGIADSTGVWPSNERSASDPNYREFVISLNSTTKASDVELLASALDSASWVNSESLADLMTEDSGSAPTANESSDSGITDSDAESTENTASQLADAHRSLDRFFSAVIDTDNADTSGSSNENPQALSRQDAQQASRSGNDFSLWKSNIYALYNAYALRSFSTLSSTQNMVDSARSLSDELFGNVKVTKPNSVVMVSESVALPVTVVNRNPFPITVTIEASAGTMMLTTQNSQQLTVAGTSEEQTTVDIYTHTSGSSYVELTLLDQNGSEFGSPVTTDVTCNVRLNDKLGYIIIGIAILLTIGGLWRQFHRKKDNS